MRLIFMLLALSLMSESARSQVFSAPAKSRGESPENALALKQEEAKELSDCEDRWEAATHMTKKQWSRTCRRVLDRLRLLDLR